MADTVMTWSVTMDPNDFSTASITFDSEIIAMELSGDVLRVTTDSGRVYTLYRLPGTPKPETHA